MVYKVYIIEGLNNTWVQSEEAAYSRGGMTRKARCLCADHIIRAVRCGIPDTYFTIPAYRIIKGKRVKGYVSQDDGTFTFTESKGVEK